MHWLEKNVKRNQNCLEKMKEKENKACLRNDEHVKEENFKLAHLQLVFRHLHGENSINRP